MEIRKKILLMYMIAIIEPFSSTTTNKVFLEKQKPLH